ncbi:MAG: type II toxin-antitoxin system Phd/YefM family antitoxin [Armatimonadetes bacterium]|nr:type II toxin-antitoxin system Phd/YefM family antitoxin [Armatimonadota bacterium]
MSERVSKSKFKPRALEYFRMIEEQGGELIITDHGRPTLKIVPFAETHEGILEILRNSIVRYADPTGPVAVGQWESLS